MDMTKPCVWKIIPWQYGYWLVCKDPDTGQWYNEIPLATHKEVEEVCEDYEGTKYWIDCKERYLSLLRDLVFAETKEKREKVWNALKEFLKSGLPWMPREKLRKIGIKI